jgi:hypothetical protein
VIIESNADKEREPRKFGGGIGIPRDRKFSWVQAKFIQAD